MNEEPKKDELLEAFENPDMNTGNENNNINLPVNNAQTNIEQPNVAQNVQQPNVVQSVQQVNSTQPVGQNIVQPTVNANENNIKQNTPDKLDVEPSVVTNQELISSKGTENDSNFLKKNIKFILIIFAIILLFIIFLPKIISIFGMGY